MASTASTSSALEVAQDYAHAWTSGDIDTALSCLADDIICDAPAGRIEGLAAYRTFTAEFVALLTSSTIIKVLADDANAAIVYSFDTPRGDGLPLHRVHDRRGREDQTHPHGLRPPTSHRSRSSLRKLSQFAPLAHHPDAVDGRPRRAGRNGEAPSGVRGCTAGPAADDATRPGDVPSPRSWTALADPSPSSKPPPDHQGKPTHDHSYGRHRPLRPPRHRRPPTPRRPRHRHRCCRAQP